MYVIYGNICHQYTPFMLAYIPAPWIRHGIYISRIRPTYRLLHIEMHIMEFPCLKYGTGQDLTHPSNIPIDFTYLDRSVIQNGLFLRPRMSYPMTLSPFFWG